MATERQIAANRGNSKKSTGPKSRGGKRRSSLNAYVHGLAGQGPLDPQWSATVEQQAHEIVDSTQGKIDMAHARSVAQAQLEVLRARSISAAIATKMFATIVDDDSVSTTNGRVSDESDRAGAIERVLPHLRVLDRYQQRALARRNRAIRLCFDG